uniref:Uncharacterized protein n=1 Tax=Lepeophtheirus salmonis TaxID=72036 RepID=A0A0K2V250_LEPSM
MRLPIFWTPKFFHGSNPLLAVRWSTYKHNKKKTRLAPDQHTLLATAEPTPQTPRLFDVGVHGVQGLQETPQQHQRIESLHQEGLSTSRVSAAGSATDRSLPIILRTDPLAKTRSLDFKNKFFY